jgi:hypothetical protein
VAEIHPVMLADLSALRIEYPAKGKSSGVKE